MSHPDPTGFGKFVPGFDFLQNLGKGAASAMPAMEQWNQWVAPTLDAKALDKRIEELKAVQFWLDQNATALKATIQALEVQKLTLATLQGMNFNPADLARAWPQAATAVKPSEPPLVRPAAPASPKPAAKAAARPAAKKAAASAMPDPMQFWGALTQQFQQIAANAMKEVAGKAATAPAFATKKEASPASVARAGAKKSAAKRPARRG